MQKKEKVIIGLNLIVSIVLLVLGVLCFAKLNVADSKESETSITTEATTTTTTTETTSTETETIPTNSESSTETTKVETTNTGIETTTSEFVGPVVPTLTETTAETLKIETIAETTSSTEVVSSVLLEKTSAATAKKITTITTKKETTPAPTTTASSKGLTLIKTFTRGTYYAYGGPRKGGSGRQLISCATGGNGVKGSIASWYLYKKLGYNYKGKRTKVYLEIKGYPKMNGWYYLDDSCAPGYNNVCDFFYINGKSCPFSRQGVVQVKCYI